MKVKITCPKCGSSNISIATNSEGLTPMYRCNQCGHKNNLFPQFEKKDEGSEE